MDLPWGACVAAALTTFVVGGLWYSPLLFLGRWEAARRSAGDFTRIAAHGAPVFVFAFLFALVGAVVHAVLLDPLHAASLEAGVKRGALLGAGIAGSSLGIQYQFANRPWTLLAIDAAYHTVQFAVYGAVFAAWPWK